MLLKNTVSKGFLKTKTYAIVITFLSYLREARAFSQFSDLCFSLLGEHQILDKSTLKATYKKTTCKVNDESAKKTPQQCCWFFCSAISYIFSGVREKSNKNTNDQ